MVIYIFYIRKERDIEGGVSVSGVDFGWVKMIFKCSIAMVF